MGKSTISMAIFNCYVSSPEGTSPKFGLYDVLLSTLSHIQPVPFKLPFWLIMLFPHYPMIKKNNLSHHFGSQNPNASAPSSFTSYPLREGMMCCDSRSGQIPSKFDKIWASCPYWGMVINPLIGSNVPIESIPFIGRTTSASDSAEIQLTRRIDISITCWLYIYIYIHIYIYIYIYTSTYQHCLHLNTYTIDNHIIP